MVGTARFARTVAPWIVLALVALALLAAAPAARAAPKTFRPTRFGDPAPGPCQPKDCSLREAVIAANANPGRDTIILEEGTYRLTRAGIAIDQGDLDVIAPLTIRGAGPGRTEIRQTVGDRVIEVGALARLLLRKVAVRGGSTVAATEDGAGILVQGGGRLTVRQAVVAGNRTDPAADGGGIHVGDGGRLEVVASTIKNNRADLGGGVFLADDATAAIERSTFASNRGDTFGGGLMNRGRVTTTSSTFTGNRVTSGYGGGIWNSQDLTATNTTVSGNRANQHGGGIAVDTTDGFTRLVNVTVAGNRADPNHVNLGDGGGIFSFGGEFRLTNTIVADNVDGSPAAGVNHDDCSTQGGPIALKGRNLIEKVAGCARTGAVGKLIKKDPKLKALRANGGPTKTHALKAGSRAIGKATRKLAPRRDQRGVLRDGKPDLGAYER